MPQGVDRAMRVLELLAREPAHLGDVAADLGVHKSTALRLLQTLESGGFARRQGGGWTATLTDLRGLLPRLLATTRQISRDLGWSGP